MLKRKLTNWFLKYLWKAVSEDDFLKWNGRTLVYKGEEMSREQVMEIRNTAETIKTLELERLINNELEYAAHEMLFTKSKTVDDMIFGKAVLYVLDVRKRKLENLSNIKV